MGMYLKAAACGFSSHNRLWIVFVDLLLVFEIKQQNMSANFMDGILDSYIWKISQAVMVLNACYMGTNKLGAAALFISAARHG
ncbi:hypothetical protein Tco_0989733 [Tanacetum coccineum]|uniref:Uncharacterized protein n=1 Tax=Tanacetum coccineum TaxID=301880 RepID=A0ABQ5EUN4_9ASTR